MATIDDFGSSGQPLQNPPLGGPNGWAAAVRDALEELRRRPLMALRKGAVDTGDADFQITGDPQDGYILNLTLPSVGDQSVGVAGLVPGATGSFDVRSFGAVGDGVADDSGTIQDALTAGTGSTVIIPTGDYRLVDTIDVPDGTTLRMSPGACLRPVNAQQDAVTMGTGATVEGGQIVPQEVWDGTNSGGWGYCLIRITGSHSTVRNVTLQGVPRVGIGVQEVNNTIIDGCRIDGRYTPELWASQPTNSIHFGIAFDPGPTAPRGNLLVTGCIVSNCVQGIYIGNYGAGDWARGVVIAGNVFSGCHNHGIYAEYTAGASISGNAFNRCAGAIVAGLNTVVGGNSIVTRDSGAYADQPSISMRNPTGCIVANNTIRGDGTPGSVVIDLSPLHGDGERSVVRDNIVTGNVLDITGGTSRGIRIGGGLMTSCDNNVISGNVITITGSPGAGVITIGDFPAQGSGNDVSGNTIRVRGDAYGIHVINCNGTRIRGNEVRLEYDAPAPVNLFQIYLQNSAQALVTDNRLVATDEWGTNVTLLGVYEAGTTFESRISGTVWDYDLTKLAGFNRLAILSSAASVIDETGPGAPTAPAGRGSLWRRTDATPALYVKTADGAGGWLACMVLPSGLPEVSGTRGGNAALANLLSALANLGLITDSTTT